MTRMLRPFRTAAAAALALIAAPLAGAAYAGGSGETASADIPAPVLVRRGGGESERGAPVRQAKSRSRVTPSIDIAPAASDAPPSLFGTVARRSGRAPAGWMDRLDDAATQFEHCLNADSGCGASTGAWRGLVREVRGRERGALIEMVNRRANRTIGYRSDRASTGRDDDWITPRRLMTTMRGDCEDYALAKYWALAAAGIAREDMYVMVVQDLVARAPHAFLVVRDGASFVLLDSRTDRVLRPDDLQGIVPVMTLGAEGAFLHGRPAAASVAMAAAADRSTNGAS